MEVMDRLCVIVSDNCWVLDKLFVATSVSENVNVVDALVLNEVEKVIDTERDADNSADWLMVSVIDGVGKVGLRVIDGSEKDIVCVSDMDGTEIVLLVNENDIVRDKVPR